jgi:hypothetical protein
MTREAKLDFLAAKATLIADAAPDESKRSMIKTLFSGICGLGTLPKIPAEAISRSDKLLEEVLERLPSDKRHFIEQQLTQRYGVARLRRSQAAPQKLMAKVLKEGRIESDDDARVVHDVLANTTNIDAIGIDAYQRLGAIFDAYKRNPG